MKRNNIHQKRVRIVRLLSAFAVIALISYAASSYFRGKSDEGDNIVVAKINNKKIYQSEIERKIREVFVGGDTKFEIPALETFPAEVIETFAKEVYLEKELASRAQKSGIAEQDNIKFQIESAKNRIIANAYVNSIIEAKISEDKIRDKYAEINSSNATKKEFAISRIVLKSKADAEKVYSNLNAKKSKNSLTFVEAVKKFSIDKASAAKSGKIAGLSEDNMPKELANIVTKLKKGEVSKPFQSKSGWEIVKLDDAKEAKIATFEEVKNELRDKIIKEETSAIYKDIFDNVKIEILVKKSEDSSKEENNEENKIENAEQKQESTETDQKKTSESDSKE